MTAEDLIYKLYYFFNVNNNLDLADKMKTAPQNISNWKSRNSINAIKKKCRELGIYNEIFGDLKLSTDEEQSNQELDNDIFSDEVLKTLDIIRTMIKNNQELDNKLNEALKSFVKDNL